MQTDNLKDLLIESARGDEAAFSRLYQHTAPHLFSLCLRIVKREDYAEDVMQEAFIQIWYSAKDYHADRGAPMAWLASIVRHRALDLLRREKSQFSRVEDLAQQPRPDPVSGPLTKTVHSSEFSAFIKCLKTLQEPQRQAILLSYYYGYTHSQLAHYMKQPLGTVKAWIRRGLKSVRDCMEQ